MKPEPDIAEEEVALGEEDWRPVVGTIDPVITHEVDEVIEAECERVDLEGWE